MDRLVLGQASGVGNLAVLLGLGHRAGRDRRRERAGLGRLRRRRSRRGRAAKRPSVQVGDPYEEKRLIEACLELLDAHLVVGIQDLGGAGLVCATSETAARGGVGMDVDVSAVPRREPGMAAYEVMTSESQERMLAIVTPGRPGAGARGVPAVGGPRRGGRPGDRGADRRARAAADPRRVRRRGAGRRPGRVPERGRPALPPAAGPAGRPGRPAGRRSRRPGRPRLRRGTCWPC